MIQVNEPTTYPNILSKCPIKILKESCKTGGLAPLRLTISKNMSILCSPNVTKLGRWVCAYRGMGGCSVFYNISMRTMTKSFSNEPKNDPVLAPRLVGYT